MCNRLLVGHTAVRTLQSSAVRCRMAFESSFMVGVAGSCAACDVKRISDVLVTGMGVIWSFPMLKIKYHFGLEMKMSMSYN